MKIVTLLFLRKDNQILLAMKKRGTGVGKWNGVGGKVEVGESVEAATKRECLEEIGVEPKNIKKVAEIEFRIPSHNFHNFAHVYQTYEWTGEIGESEEMAPRWFTHETIPYEQMWTDDQHWLPTILAGQKVQAFFEFDRRERITKSEIKHLDFLTESPII